MRMDAVRCIYSTILCATFLAIPDLLLPHDENLRLVVQIAAVQTRGDLPDRYRCALTDGLVPIESDGYWIN
jgi:hypothetical protein